MADFEFYSLDPHWSIEYEDGRKEDIVLDARGFYHVPGGANFGHAVVFTQTVESDRAFTARIGMGADWFWKAELNGVICYDCLLGGNGSGVEPDNHFVDLPFQAGKNEIKVTVKSGSGGWSLAVGRADGEMVNREYAYTPIPEKVIGHLKMTNGGNLAPELHNGQLYPHFNQDFKEMLVPLTRLHDCPLNNAGMRLVDIPQIFGNFKADPDDPDNYYFEQTDDYIQNSIELGTQVYYRLGASIEHSVKHYFTDLHMTAEKWVKVCSNIIRHYNEGWANGFHLGIKYWEIWNEYSLGKEGDDPVLYKQWAGTLKEFQDFYVEAAKGLKANFPQLMIGGPGDATLAYTEDFLKNCRDKNAPLDFYSYHTYAGEYNRYLSSPQKVRDMLDRFGYTKTEIHLNEWHCLTSRSCWEKGSDITDTYGFQLHANRHGIHAAAFAIGCMVGWQDTPLDMAFYYTVTCSPSWGVFYGSYRSKTKCYYALKMFNTLYRDAKNRVSLTDDSWDMYEKLRTMAAVSDDKKTFMMVVSNFKQNCTVRINACNLKEYDLTLYTLDEDQDMAESPLTPDENGMIVLARSTSAAWLIKGIRK